ncbi:MAG: CHAT domain-containing protein [bacterium]|nr:CHAT domain-containing protein [bacterium]
MAPAFSANWSRLPGAANEITTALIMADTCRTEVLTAEAASQNNVVRSLPGKRILYFATHGYCFLDPARDLQLSDDKLYLKEFLERDPMISSGLVLAGANLANVQSSGDAYLTAADVAGMNLQGVEIGFLSACETGVGRIVPGEGVYALRRAFELAGVNATVSALWRIDDKSTSMLFSRLKSYVHLPIGEALSLAMRDEIQTRRSAGLSTHPFFWGGFVAGGQWRTNIAQ